MNVLPDVMVPCEVCHGKRYNRETLEVRYKGKSIADVLDMTINQAVEFFENVPNILQKIKTIQDVGLGYIKLGQPSTTLSGGESQRVKLATELSKRDTGKTIYILDEPTTGLHFEDIRILMDVLQKLVDRGNTVLIIEHNLDVIKLADHIIDIGPEAGRHGGQVVWSGDYRHLVESKTDNKKPTSGELPLTSHTLNYLLGRERIELPNSRRKWNRKITIKGARENNLKGIDVDFPLNVFTVVTGVSGSGKSTLVRNIFYPAIQRHLDETAERPGEFVALEGDLDAIRAVDFVDQNPIGRSSRSNPVTYVKAYDEIRKLMAEQPLAQQMEMKPAFFSFNADGGRCEECKGAGTVKVEMQFMADLELECETCHGHRFKNEVLEVKFEGKNIYDILEMTVNQAIEFFDNYGKKKIVNRLRPLQDVGLGYIKLGQSSSTLSGGENQRVKLAYYLGQERAVPTLFIFDEPTTGLHFHDISRLLHAFNALLERGHSLVVIEHNLDVVKTADPVIDLGPEGGAAGGELVFAGTPEALVEAGKGYTAHYLAPLMNQRAM